MISDIKQWAEWILRMVVTACLVVGVVATVSAESLTEQQLQQLERLTPEQRAALMESQQQRLERLTPEQRAAVKQRLEKRQQFEEEQGDSAKVPLPVVPVLPAEDVSGEAVKDEDQDTETKVSKDIGEEQELD